MKASAKTQVSGVGPVNHAPSSLVAVLFVAGVLLGSTPCARASDDYGPAIWRRVYCNKWYSSGYGHRFVVIHVMQGYYETGIAYLRRCGVSVSCHYVVSGKKDYTSDAPAGEISQLVREAYYAWHARCWNQYSLGTEHEGFVSNLAWFTEEMYQASAKLHRHLCDKFGIPKDRNHVIGHDQKRLASWREWMLDRGYSSSFITCNDHTDPGPYLELVALHEPHQWRGLDAVGA